MFNIQTGLLVLTVNVKLIKYHWFEEGLCYYVSDVIGISSRDVYFDVFMEIIKLNP